ncbi:MAG TPA: ribosome silencing factor [Nitrospiria bacterium]|nr:ribosome silencing factor [Nitrospiria bacterium]
MLDLLNRDPGEAQKRQTCYRSLASICRIIYNGKTVILEINTIDTDEKAVISAIAAGEKKGIDIVLLDVSGLTTIADYFLICSGESERQVKAITEAITESLQKKGVKPAGIEGDKTLLWVLIDYRDLIVHTFKKEAREFYALEKIWADAPRIDIKAESTSPAIRKQIKGRNNIKKKR